MEGFLVHARTFEPLTSPVKRKPASSRCETTSKTVVVLLVSNQLETSILHTELLQKFDNYAQVMIVYVKVKDASVKISCGNGRQSFRWLGSVVQSRIKQFGVLRNKFEEDNYIVTEIRNAEGQLLNPDDMLCEHATSDTLNVTAVVASSFPVDEWEIPEMGDWLKGAYVKSKTGQHWMSEIEAWRESQKSLKAAQNAGEDKEANILVHKAHPPSSNLIQIGFDFSESDINSAFDLDWAVMRWDWLQPSELLRSQLGDTLKSNYAFICNFFTHYCGVGQGEESNRSNLWFCRKFLLIVHSFLFFMAFSVGQRYGMTMQEFGHLLHYLRVCNLKTSDDLIGESLHDVCCSVFTNLALYVRRGHIREDRAARYDW